MGISLTILAVIYYPLGFFFFNFVKPKEVFSSASYKKVTFSRGLGTIGGGLIYAILIIGILFKILQLPGSGPMLMVGTISTLIFLVVVLIKFIRNRSNFLLSMLKRTVIWALMGVIFISVSGLTLVKVFYRDNPAYIEAYEQLMQDPRNEELQRKAEEARNNAEH